MRQTGTLKTFEKETTLSHWMESRQPFSLGRRNVKIIDNQRKTTDQMWSSWQTSTQKRETEEKIKQRRKALAGKKWKTEKDGIKQTEIIIKLNRALSQTNKEKSAVGTDSQKSANISQ